MRSLDTVLGFIEKQLNQWGVAAENHSALTCVSRRDINLGNLEAGVQWNPARIVSTNARVDKENISRRPCFLCSSNRPEEQIFLEWFPGWEILVNPFPILRNHLTIVHKEHVPQSHIPKDIIEIAANLPGMTVFYNGAGAGASAPDHLHLQAVMSGELPLVRLVSRVYNPVRSEVVPSESLDISVPFRFFTGVISDDETASEVAEKSLQIGGDPEGYDFHDPALVNAFYWKDNISDAVRFIIIPRKAHRPECFYAEGTDHRLVSPGCIDMAGLIVTPREKDFKALTADEIIKIYSDVSFPS